MPSRARLSHRRTNTQSLPQHSVPDRVRDMPALANQRQERFCQLVKQGIPPYRAYPLAGYNAHPGAPYRLCDNVRVKRRIAEITKGLAMKTRVTVESLTQELDEARELAARVDQPSAMTAATIAKGKLHGLMVERKETGQPGDFTGLQSAAEVLAVVETELGKETAALLSAALARTEQASVPDALDATRDDGASLN